MLPAELHSFFIYVFFGYLLIFPAVLVLLRLFAVSDPGQRLQAYLMALFTPFAGFILYHTVLLKRCQTGLTPSGPLGRVFDALCQAGFLAVSYLSPLLAGLLAIGLLKAAAGALFAVRLRRQAVAPPASIQERVGRLLAGHCAAMGLACPEVIYSNRESFIALTAGVRRPALYLSAPLLAEFTPAELEHILLHELAHIRRGDVFRGWLLRLLRDLVFFSPFSNALLLRCQLETERLCDRVAVRRTGGDALAYAATLLKAWRLLARRRATESAFAAGLAGPANSLELRIRSLLNDSPMRSSGVGSRAAGTPEAATIDAGRAHAPLFLAALAALFTLTILYLGYIC